MRPAFRDLIWGAALVLALSVRFAVETSLVNRLPAAVAVAFALVPAAAALALVAWHAPLRTTWERGDSILAAAVGVGSVWLAPFLVASVRGTDAPPGAEVLFLTTAVWGLLIVVAGSIAAWARWSPTRVAAALLGVTGAAGILANWERPSSFSPFIRYPSNEAVMLLAGLLCGLGVVALARLVRRHGSLVAARAVAVPAAVASVIAAVLLLRGDILRVVQPSVWPFGLVAAAATFAVLLGWSELLERRSPATVGAAYFLPPVALTGLRIVEEATRVYGPNPIVVAPAIAGIVVSCFAAAVVIVAGRAVAGWDMPAGRRWIAGWILAILAILVSLVALTRPDLAVSVHGELTNGQAFAAQFVMSGAETVGGWLAACCSLLVLAWAWSREAVTRRMSALLLVTVAVAAAAWLPLHTTPTHAWTSWIPAEVQQDFGTEYASKTVIPTTNPWEPAALALSALAAVLLTDRRARDGKPEQGTEVS